MARPLSTIAFDICREWKTVNYAARPYLDAMTECSSIRDMFYADTAKSIVAYFLANASGFRGDRARSLKAELKALLKSVERN